MDRILVFALTATGFPIQKTFSIYPNPREQSMYEKARVLRFSYSTYALFGEKEAELIETVDMYVNQSCITDASIERTGIDGKHETFHSVQDFSIRFFRELDSSSPLIVSYNASLHFHLFGAELYRHGLKDELQRLISLLPTVFCLMQQSVEICKIPSPRKNVRYKTPSMFEICSLLAIESPPPSSSSSCSSSSALRYNNLRHIDEVARCFFQLKKTYFSSPVD
jgi:hypothetical protein